jgi:homoserine O-succinyltransferase
MIFVVESTNDVVCDGNGCVDVALVNNMPDAALRQTELQFALRLDAGSGDVPVHLRRYTLSTIARQPVAAEHIGTHYFPIDALWGFPPDAMIVTGCEPLAPDLSREPFWPELSRLLHWARENVPSTIASCLAAHGALLAFDAVHRNPLPLKRSGVFAQEVRPAHPLTVGLPARIVMPHSRLNDVPTEAIEAAGYRPLIHSPELGWTAAAKGYPHHLLVLLQGHPEYDADTLLLEFRRDVRRYLNGQRPEFPPVPAGYFPPDTEPVLARLRDEATSERDPQLAERFPTDDLLRRVSDTWRDPAERFFGNWLAAVRELAAERIAT